VPIAFRSLSPATFPILLVKNADLFCFCFSSPDPRQSHSDAGKNCDFRQDLPELVRDEVIAARTVLVRATLLCARAWRATSELYVTHVRGSWHSRGSGVELKEGEGGQPFESASSEGI